jgi:hypothetical protein
VTWSGLDIAVLGLLGAQAVALGLVIRAGLAIASGPVRRTRGRIAPLAAKGQALPGRIQHLLEKRELLVRIAARIGATRAALAPIAPPPGMVITPASLRKGFVALQSVRAVLAAGKARISAEQAQTAPTPAVAGRARRAEKAATGRGRSALLQGALGAVLPAALRGLSGGAERSPAWLSAACRLVPGGSRYLPYIRHAGTALRVARQLQARRRS